MEAIPKKEPPGRTGRLSKNRKLCQLLLVNHLIDDVSDDRQHEFFVRVSFIHKKNPGREDGQPEEWEDGQSEEANDWYVRDNEPDNPQCEPNRNDAYVESDGLHTVKFHERTLVDEQEDEAGDPSEKIAKQSGDVFFNSFGSGGCYRGCHRPTLRHT